MACRPWWYRGLLQAPPAETMTMTALHCVCYRQVKSGPQLLAFLQASIPQARYALYGPFALLCGSPCQGFSQTPPCILQAPPPSWMQHRRQTQPASSGEDSDPWHGEQQQGGGEEEEEEQGSDLPTPAATPAQQSRWQQLQLAAQRLSVLVQQQQPDIGGSSGLCQRGLAAAGDHEYDEAGRFAVLCSLLRGAGVAREEKQVHRCAHR